jgi:hypothetical protein
MRAPNQDRSARVVTAGQAFVRNVGRRFDEPAADAPTNPKAASDEPALAL